MIKKKLPLITYAALAIIAFIFNFWVGTKGVFPIDTFLHYDAAYKILSGEKPVKDYWTIFGITLDYIQSIFFYLFGVNWISYISHSSLFNSVLTIIFFKFLNKLNFQYIYSIPLAICFLILAYPISGVPFIDHHATFFSLISLFIFYFGLVNKNYKQFIFIPIIFGLAFFSKPVPSAYLCLVFIIIFIAYFIPEKKKEPFLYILYGAILLLLLTFFFLQIENIPISNFFEQLILYPFSIGGDRTNSILEAVKIRMFNYKFIYVLLFYLIFLLTFKKNFRKFSKPNLYLLVTFILFSIIMVMHQILTKNQNFIFFLIPLNTCLVLYVNNHIELKNSKRVNFFFLILCIFLTFKYFDRFIDKRKFHDLQNVNLKNAISAKTIHESLYPLNWITLNYEDPKEEVKMIKELVNNIERSGEKILLISNYNFVDSITEKKVLIVAKNFDNVVVPQKKNKYRENFKTFFSNNIKKNKIKEIYLFFPKINNFQRFGINLKNFLYPMCFDSQDINSMTIKLKIKNC